MWYIKSGVFNSRDFKNEISFPFRIPSDPNKGVAGGALGRGKGAETSTQQKIMWYIKYGVFNSRDFINEISFPFRIPSDPNKGVAGGALGGGRGAETYTQQKIMWYIKSGVFNSRDFKNEISFPFRIPLDPNKGVAGRALGGKGGWDLYTTKENLINRIWIWFIRLSFVMYRS